MRLLADENLPRPVIARLRQEGLDVLWIQEALPGASDVDVLGLAAEEGRILLTFDKDFGALAFRGSLPAQSSVVLLRFALSSMEAAASKILGALRSQETWKGVFVVVEESRIRVVPLPPLPRP
ncbi:MAG: DUF5615 family PIN-like protein [Holophagaceae bacterium]